jgi:DNA polymerase-4
VTVKVKYADFSQVTRSRTSPGQVDSRAALAEMAVELVRSKRIRLLGVTVSNFGEGADAAQASFDFG